MPGPIAIAFRAVTLATAAFAAFVIIFAFSGCGEDIKLERRTVTYPNGKSVREDWTFIRRTNGDSLEHGVHKKFFWSGAVSESVIWKFGKRDGSAQAYYENGSVKWQKSYVDGKKQGTWRLSYKDGHPWMVTNYDKDQLSGVVQVWDKSGAAEPKSAQFTKGACTTGDCALLDAPAVPSDVTATEKVEMTRNWDMVKEFLD